MNKLEDGWPESVEEQSLLLLVRRHYITRQYIKDVLQAEEKSSIQTIYRMGRLIRRFLSAYDTSKSGIFLK